MPTIDRGGQSMVPGDALAQLSNSTGMLEAYKSQPTNFPRARFFAIANDTCLICEAPAACPITA
jgi:hypothetical protein